MDAVDCEDRLQLRGRGVRDFESLRRLTRLRGRRWGCGDAVGGLRFTVYVRLGRRVAG